MHLREELGSLILSNLLSGTGKLVLASPGATASRLNKPNFLPFCTLLYVSGVALKGG